MNQNTTLLGLLAVQAALICTAIWAMWLRPGCRCATTKFWWLLTASNVAGLAGELLQNQEFTPLGGLFSFGIGFCASMAIKNGRGPRNRRRVARQLGAKSKATVARLASQLKPAPPPVARPVGA